MCSSDQVLCLLGDSTSLAGLKKQLSVSIPLKEHQKKMKERDEAHALSEAGLQAEVVRLREAEKQRLSEIETLRKNGDELRLLLSEAVYARDEAAKAAQEHELAQEQLTHGLVAEAERVNGLILGKWSSLFICFNCGFFFLTLPA